ncbi:MAG TPA: hypothetical protein VL625_00335 [Patescibacteria group bacterium]|nr:hypothetical protein [Patescibacteria group bacterium]
MNVALTLSRNNKAMLIYDQPLGFQPSWVETSADGEGLRVIGADGQSLKLGVFYRHINDKLGQVGTVLMVQMGQDGPIEGFDVPFVSQTYY